MKRYIAFLRGINISGKNKLSMKDLKRMLEDAGFSDVKTLLNSGNAGFSCEADDEQDLAERISGMIGKRFGLDIPVYIIARDTLCALLEKAPDWWGTDDKKIYDNLIFLLDGKKAQDIAARIGEPSEGIERIAITDNAVFWSFVLGKHPKANWYRKTASAGIAEVLTIRTANTCRKAAEL